jgi:hypothetical protein
MPDRTSTRPSWWQTIPGILTGLAAIITAVTGLLVVLNRTSDRPETSRTPSPTTAAATPAPASPSSAAASSGESIALPATSQVKLAGGAAVITILSARVEPIDPDRRSLTFVLRHTNAGRYPANFWGASYRLIVDDVPRAPTNALNEVVDGDSAKEGEVVFEVPGSVKNVVLQISSGDEKSRIPFTLP